MIFSYPTALEMVASGSVNVKPLITHTYKLEETLQAFERAKTGEGGAIKVSYISLSRVFLSLLIDALLGMYMVSNFAALLWKHPA